MLLNMATAQRKIGVRHLREDFASSYATLPAGQSRVDRAGGIIRGVKVLGLVSQNTHGISGVKGTRYLPEAARAARGMYEGAKVNIDHPEHDRNDVRRCRDRFGVLRNVRFIEGEPFADLHYLKSHPLAAQVCEAAERSDLHDQFALSHNALGEGIIDGDYYVVSRIVEVSSVDLVADGGTNKSLFESKNAMTKTNLRRLIAESKMPASLKARLLEEGETAMPDAMGADMAAPEDGDWKQSLLDAIGKLVNSGSPDDHAKAQKIMSMLKADSAPQETQKADDDTDEDKKKKMADTEEARDSEGHGWNNKKEQRAAAARMSDEGDWTGTHESLKRENRGLKELLEAGVSLSAIQQRAFMALGDADRKAYLAEIKESKGTTSGATSYSPHVLAESRRNGQAKPVANFDEFKACVLN